MIVALDIDNVIVDTTANVVDYINERLPNINLKIEDITSYWIEGALPSEYRWIVEAAFEDRAMWKRVKLIDGAAEAIEKLYNEGCEIYFATATTANNFRKKVRFLERSFPFFPKDYVRRHAISIKNKQLLDVDYLVDDCTDNLTGRRRYKSICFDYPWNQDFVDNGDTRRRAYNWSEIYSIIREGY